MKKIIGLMAMIVALMIIGCGDDKKDDSDKPSQLTDDDAKPSSLVVLCTGQNKCYNNSSEITCPTEGSDFYGQDAEYSDLCTPKNFTANSETATDNNTGLIWQRYLPTTYAGCSWGDPVGARCTWQEAINYCGNLNLAGNSSWRLPNIEELETLIDYGKTNPAIDTAIFPNTLSIYFWSSSSKVNFAGSAWDVGLDRGSVSDSDKTNNRYVRCVR